MNPATSLIAPDSALFRVLDVVADATNLLLVVWLLAVLIIGTRRHSLAPTAWLAVVLSIAVVYLIKIIDGRLDLWERLGLDYSTHSALAAALAISLFFLDVPRRVLALAVLVAYEALIMLLGFHSVGDVATTLAVVAPLVVLLHIVLGKKHSSPAVQT